jgi:ketosteroid isomerase-like protein
MAEPDLGSFVDAYHRALDAFFRGDAEPAKRLYSHQDDASLANPFGPIAVGWEEVEKTMARAASNYRDGRATSFDTVATYVTPALAYLVEVERFEATIGEEEESASGALRVTSILRLEGGAWRIVHRHADPITTPRAAESVIDS